MGAWNGWYHVNGNTYGTWLRGDPRGWRARRHREHVEGDYKNPPPEGEYAELHRRSKSLLKREPIRLNARQSRAALDAMVAKLLEFEIEVLAVSVDAVHYHILARFPDDQVKGPVGWAKKNASHDLTELGLAGTVWAKGCRPLPITGRRHQLNVFRYIAEHASKGACVWTFRDGVIGE